MEIGCPCAVFAVAGVTIGQRAVVALLATPPKGTESPALKVMGIRDDIVGQRRRFVDKRIDGDKQRQTRRIFQSFLRHAAQPGDYRTRGWSCSRSGLQPVRIPRQRRRQQLGQLPGDERIPGAPRPAGETPAATFSRYSSEVS